MGPLMAELARVSVIIVSYNTRELLVRLLTALRDEGPVVHEVIVVDNASHDGSVETVAEEFPEVTLIRNSTNRGFGAANNQGLRAMSGDLALFLNSDAVPRHGAIETLSRVMDDPEVVACGGRLEHPDHSLQESACSQLTLWAVFCEQTWIEKLVPGSEVFSPYWVSGRMIERGSGPHEVEQVMGACLMMRPGLEFDERFFLYCEDTELCRRLRQTGRIMYVPKAVFEHALGASSSTSRWQAVARYNRGKELYFRIHHGRIASFLCWKVNRCGAFLRLTVYLVMAIATLFFVPRLRNSVWLWLRVLFAPISGPARPRDSG